MNARATGPAALDGHTLDRLAEVAADWIVSLTGDDEAGRARALAEFDAWKRADPRHAAAAAHMERLIANVRSVRDSNAGAARAALRSPGRRGRRLAAALAVALAAPLLAWAALAAYPPAYLLADLRTSARGWETRTLPDGSRITLRGASAVNLRFDARRREIDLVQGEILVEVAKDAARPFVVDSADGGIRALGTRFVVDRSAGATTLTMLESKVRVWPGAIEPAADAPAAVVGAGQRVSFTRAGLGPIESVDARSVGDAWKYHQLVAEDRPLADVLDELGRHRPGRILYDRGGVAALRVSAVLPLDDTDRALALLAASFPQLRVRTPAPWLVMVDAPAPP